MSQHMYETFKNVVNEDFSNEFKSFKNSAFIFWGKTDRATSLASGERINQLIKNSYFKAYEEDHYFFLKNSQDIGNEIVRRILYNIYTHSVYYDVGLVFDYQFYSGTITKLN